MEHMKKLFLAILSIAMFAACTPREDGVQVRTNAQARADLCMRRPTYESGNLVSECLAMCGAFYQASHYDSRTTERQECVNAVMGFK